MDGFRLLTRDVNGMFSSASSILVMVPSKNPRIRSSSNQGLNVFDQVARESVRENLSESERAKQTNTQV